MKLKTSIRDRIKKTKESMNTHLDAHLDDVYAQPAERRTLIEYEAGLIAFILCDLVAVVALVATERIRFLYFSLFVTALLIELIFSAHRRGSVGNRHYAATFLISLVYGFVMFSFCDNERGIFLFGLGFPVLSNFILKPFWGNLLIAFQLPSAILANRYINPTKMNEDTCRIYICVYIMCWLFGVVMEVTCRELEKRMLEQKEKLATLANFDSLTHLSNRRHFYERVGERYPENAMEAPVTVVILDVDNFKRINDTYGHSVGDEVLAETARRIQSSIRSSDLSCRWGGEEFLILALAESEEGSMHFGQRIRSAIGDTAFDCSIGPLSVTVSVGVIYQARFYQNCLEEAIRRADEQLYRAKRTGKNKVCSGSFSGGSTREEIVAESIS